MLGPGGFAPDDRLPDWAVSRSRHLDQAIVRASIRGNARSARPRSTGNTNVSAEVSAPRRGVPRLSRGPACGFSFGAAFVPCRPRCPMARWRPGGRRPAEVSHEGGDHVAFGVSSAPRRPKVSLWPAGGWAGFACGPRSCVVGGGFPAVPSQGLPADRGRGPGSALSAALGSHRALAPQDLPAPCRQPGLPQRVPRPSPEGRPATNPGTNSIWMYHRGPLRDLMSCRLLTGAWT